MFGFQTQPYRTGVSAPPIIRTPPPFPVFVDTVAGTSGGSGDGNNPVNSLSLAMNMVAGWDDWKVEIINRPTVPIRIEHVYNSSLPLSITGHDNEPWHIRGSVLGASWTSHGGSVYSMALTGSQVPFVVVETMTELVGDRYFFLKLRDNAFTPTTPAPGESGFSGGRVYIRLPDSSNPAVHTIEIMRLNKGIQTTGTGRLTLRNVDGRYYNSSVLLNGISTALVGGGLMTVEDSDLSFVGTGCVGSTGRNEETICTRVRSYRSENDGFNVHNPSGGLGKMVLNDCDGGYSGDVAGTSAQGASNHETSWMVINGGRYNYNVSGGMVVIENAKCDINGTTDYGPVIMDRNMRLGNTPGPVAAQAGCAWLDSSTGSVTSTVAGDVRVSNGQGVGVRLATAGAVPGIFNIQSVGNALPNVIAV